MEKYKKNTKKDLNEELILRELENKKNEILKYGVIKIGLFGSFLNNKNKDESDIDIIVKFEFPTYESYIELLYFLRKIFGKKIDLVTEDSLSKNLLYILKEAKYARL